jgi:uncharacterized phage protein (TIGR01671 family)
MNRQIKFRAWDKTYSLMNYKVQVGNTDHSDPNYTCNSIWVDSGDFKTIGWMNADDKCIDLMQYTGLKDKNGKEIYEGDILSLNKEASLFKRCPIKVIGSVNFVGGKFEVKTIKCTNLNVNKKGSVHFGMKVMDWIHLPNFYESEVIGNIFENPELLQE